jgi:hypothetical protein
MTTPFFLPVDKLISVTTTNNDLFVGFFSGIIDFAGMPSIFLTDQKKDGSRKEIIIPITQLVTFEVTKEQEKIIQIGNELL